VLEKGVEISWRRSHGDTIVASVTYHVESRDFEASACCSKGPDPVTHHKTRLRSLQSAKAAADNLARRAFRHRCEFTMCGDWTGGEWLGVSPE
jgi:hypothetical protein